MNKSTIEGKPWEFAGQTPEAIADVLVAVMCPEAGGPLFVQLRKLLPAPVSFGPYANPSIAESDARKLKGYLAALIVGCRPD